MIIKLKLEWGVGVGVKVVYVKGFRYCCVSNGYIGFFFLVVGGKKKFLSFLEYFIN